MKVWKFAARRMQSRRELDRWKCRTHEFPFGKDFFSISQFLFPKKRTKSIVGKKVKWPIFTPANNRYSLRVRVTYFLLSYHIRIWKKNNRKWYEGSPPIYEPLSHTPETNYMLLSVIFQSKNRAKIRPVPISTRAETKVFSNFGENSKNGAAAKKEIGGAFE